MMNLVIILYKDKEKKKEDFVCFLVTCVRIHFIS